MNEVLWSPSQQRISESNLNNFFQSLKNKFSLPGELDYQTLHKFSVNRPQYFYDELFSFFDIKFQGSLNPAYQDLGFKKYSWYENVGLNFCENLLKKGKDEKIALIERLESGRDKKITYGQLRKIVSGLQKALKPFLKENDVLACYMPNTSHTVISMLAATSLGGVFTSTSCDFGIEGVVDRFGQSRPKVLVAARSYMYGGKVFDQTEKICEIVDKVSSIEKVILVDFVDSEINFKNVPKSELWQDFFSEDENAISYTVRKFGDPLYIMYSSGTTGKPKCIVHGVGGTLLQHVKELGLNSDLKEDKTIFFFTTCGWMMWNWLVSSLYFGATIVLYEGSPAHPTFNEYLKIIEKYKINIFGTSPKYLKALSDFNADLKSIDLSSLETILSTGSPLLPEQFDYVYDHFKKDVLLGSISGGTDILGCFFLASPINPVYRGELQVRGLGMDVQAFNDNGQAIIEEEGELVCLKSFPSRPIYFLNDSTCEKINDAYFSRYENIWYHGDYIKITNYGGCVVLGRSDATLNPGGVRIGTAEIYRQTETINYIEDSICVGHNFEGDVDVILFVKLKSGFELNSDKIKEIKKVIKDNTTPRHVPKRVIQVSDIPYTRSGKKVEMAVSKLINGKSINNLEAIANPGCLNEYQNFKA